MKQTEAVSGGLVRRVIYYRPLRAYRTEKGGALDNSVPAFSYDETNAVVLRDSFFRLDPIARLGFLVHELTHLADVGRRISKSKEWADLIHPRIRKIREMLGAPGTGADVPTGSAAKEIARANGLPSTYAATAAGEALAEIVAYHLIASSYEAPEPIRRFITAHELAHLAP
ncbi:MAG: hypothetical protein QF902_00520 [Rhodospirillales bacterium]|nr:hypothetical protein [Rhodospirillales bacterium]